VLPGSLAVFIPLQRRIIAAPLAQSADIRNSTSGLVANSDAGYSPNGSRISRAIVTATTLVAMVITLARVPSSIGHS
jgi:hypothetical protein